MMLMRPMNYFSAATQCSRLRLVSIAFPAWPSMDTGEEGGGLHYTNPLPDRRWKIAHIARNDRLGLAGERRLEKHEVLRIWSRVMPGKR